MKRDARKIALRFAVYTRVSTDSGLDQDFNSFAALSNFRQRFVNEEPNHRPKILAY